MINYIIGALAIGIVVGVAYSFIKSAKKGKSSCGCSGSCSSGSCSSCSINTNKIEIKQNMK